MPNQDHENPNDQDDRCLVAAWLNSPRSRPWVDAMQLAEWLERGSGEGEDALAERQLAADPQLLAAVIGTGRGPSSLRSTALPGPARQAPGRRRWLADRRRASQVAHAATLMLAVIGGLALGRDLATTRLQTEVRHLQVLLSFDAEYPAMPGGSP